MSRYLSYTHSSRPFVSRSKIFNLRVFKAEHFLAFLGSMLLMLSLAYIVMSNMSSASSFKLRDARARIDELNLQNKKSETELANRESIARLEEEARRIGLVPIGRVKYIESAGNTVALK